MLSHEPSLQLASWEGEAYEEERLRGAKILPHHHLAAGFAAGFASRLLKFCDEISCDEISCDEMSYDICVENWGSKKNLNEAAHKCNPEALERPLLTFVVSQACDYGVAIFFVGQRSGNGGIKRGTCEKRSVIGTVECRY